jgi:serine phosphatase RsbU (regulator of sigma subunit)
MPQGRLTALSGTDKGAHHTFYEVCEIGRASTCDIIISSPTVSRHQARITCVGGRFEIEHIGSSSPTLLNDRPIRGVQPIVQGDEIRIADRTYRFDVPGATRPPLLGQLPDQVTVLSGGDSGQKIVRAISSDFSILDASATGEHKTAEEIAKLASALKTISAVAKDLAAILDVEELLTEISSRVLEAFSASRSAILVKDERGSLVPRAVNNKKQPAKSTLNISSTVLQHVIDKREAVLSRDAGVDARFQGVHSIQASGVRSIMCAPLIWRRDLVGAIYLDCDTLGAFSHTDLEVMVGIADQCATALGIAQLHREMTRRQLVEQDLRVAQRIQSSFLPMHPPAVEGMTFRTAYTPARHVGGDFYDFIPLGSRMAIVVGDVSGKGVGAALHMARVSRDFRFLVAADPEPSRVLAEMNRLVIDSGQEDMFVTLLYVLLDLDVHVLTIANAGHLPPVLRRAGSTRAQLLSIEPGHPIGLMPDAQFGHGQFEMKPEDSLLLYTDGLTEAMNAKRELLGVDRVIDALSGGAGDPASLLERAKEAIQRHAAGAATSDDTTLLAFGLDDEGPDTGVITEIDGEA